jgi:phosphatidate cytidylyltransferase
MFARVDWYQTQTYTLFSIVLVVLIAATIVSVVLSRGGSGWGVESAILRRFRHKLQVWWLMVAIFAIGFLLGRIGVVVLFGFVSFWALREYITMTPTRRGDHRTLFWVFFIFTPLQYVLVGLGSTPPVWAGGSSVDYYDYFSIMIPVYASLFIPARAAIAGDYKRFLERSAKIQSGLLVCVYSLSYAPALLDLSLRQTDGTPWSGSTVTLLIFFVLIAQLATVFERMWGRLAGRNVIAENINASRTWEGFLGSMVTTGLVAATLSWATPFLSWEAGILGGVIAVMALAGTLTMSAIKRDRGVQDTGTLVQGHAGVLDQIDNVCFAAPVFYHVTRFFWS